MKKCLFLGSFLFAALIIKSQDWAEYMQRPDANLYTAQTLFSNYWQGKNPDEKGKGYKAFKRWEHFAEPRVHPSGKLSELNKTGPNWESWYASYQAQQNQNPGGKFNNNNNLIASSTWTPMGPFGPIAGSAGGQLLKSGRLNFVTINPTNTLNLWVGAPAGGLWRSNDGGSTWTTNTDNWAQIGFSDLCIDPTNTLVMYAATGDGDAGDTRSTGIYKSTNGGSTWAATSLTYAVTSNFLIRRLIINPATPSVVIAATNGGIYRTINGGTSWSQVQAGSHFDLEFQPGNPSVVYATGTTTFKRSADGGATWTTISAGIPTTSCSRMAIAVSANSANVVYVLAGNNTNYGLQGFYRSTTAGVSFTNMAVSVNLLGWSSTGSDSGGQAWYDLCVAANPLNANEVVTGGVNVWRTTNGGSTWNIYGHWTGSGAPFTHADHHDLDYAANGTLFNANDGTIYRRAPGAASWTEISGTMNISQIYKIGTSALTANKWISGHQDNGTSQWTGSTYSACIGGDGMDCFIDRTNNNTMFGSTQNGGWRRSTNGGVNWSMYTSGMAGSGPWVSIWKQDPQTAGMIYGGWQNMARSLLANGTWTMMTNLPIATGNIREFAVAPSNSLVIYVLKNSGIFKTVNGGTSWTTVTGTVPVGSGAPTFITISPTDPNKAWVTLSGYSAGNKVFRTTDGGATWTNFTANLPNLPANCSVYQPGSPDRIYVGMDVGVYYRDNSMANWVLYNTGLPNAPLEDMEISPADPNKLVAATYGRGVWVVDVIANAAPISAFNYSGTPCTGNPIMFYDVSTNGPTTWSWSVSPAAGVTVNTPASQNPTITFANAGTYTVTLVASNGNGPGSSATQTIAINTTPTVVISNSVQSMCSGNTVNINATGATTYSWSNGATTASIAVSPTSTMIYTVTGSNGACTNVKTATVNVTTSPTVTVNNGTVCSGSAATLVATGAATYSWSNGSTSSSIAVTPSATTIYTVTGYNGSCTNVKTSTVTVNTTPTVIVSNSVQSMCSGNTVNINASGAATYSWSNGATSATIAVSPSATTIYTVTGSNGGCTNVKTATVNVTTSPTVTVNNGTVCSGTPATLIASGAATYSWSNGSTSSSIAVTPSATTIYTVTGFNGSCSNVKTSTVSVNTTPTVIVSNSVQSICSGATVNINASGAATYSWSNGATTSVIAVSPAVTTIYTVTGYNGACNNVKTATVNVSTSPTVNVNSSSICSGQSATLTASGATSYSWSNGPTGASQVVSPGVTTVFTVTGTNGSCSNVKTSTVTVNQTPTVAIANNSQTTCPGVPVTINASGANSYFWNNGATTSAITVSPGVTTVYTVTGMNGTCQDVQTATVVIVVCSGVMQNNNEMVMFSIFPNPASDHITIYYPSGSTTLLQLELSDALGRIIVVKSNEFSGSNPALSISLAEVAKGPYFLKLIPEKGEPKVIKLIKE